MGWRFPYSDIYGNDNPTAYASITALNYQRLEKQIRIEFSLWKNEKAHTDGKQPLPDKVVIIVRANRTEIAPGVTIPSYDEILATTAQAGNLFDQLAAAAYQVSAVHPQFQGATKTDKVDK